MREIRIENRSFFLMDDHCLILLEEWFWGCVFNRGMIIYISDVGVVAVREYEA